MKKTFHLTHPKIKVARLVDAIKSDVRKYLKRERKKALPEGTDFWDFDCKFGETAEALSEVHVSAISEAVDDAAEKKLESFYLEIIAKPRKRTKKPKPDEAVE